MMGRGDFNINYVQYYPTFTLRERVRALRTWVFSKSKKSLCPVNPNISFAAGDIDLQILHNRIFFYWTEIYSRLRASTTLHFNMPKVGRFNNYGAVLRYTSKHPDNKLAVSFDLASALVAFNENPERDIALRDLTLSYWRHHPQLKNIVNYVSSDFQRKLTTQINDDQAPLAENVITLHY